MHLFSFDFVTFSNVWISQALYLSQEKRWSLRDGLVRLLVRDVGFGIPEC